MYESTVENMAASDVFLVLFDCFFCVVVYGVTTGFGKFASVVIPRDKLK